MRYIIVDLEAARFAIDLLDVLEQKTKGNLTKEEADDLKQVLANLRTRLAKRRSASLLWGRG